MTNLTMTGLPVLAIGVGSILIGSLPVWLGAQVTGAGHPTLLRSALALITGIIGSFIGVTIGGPVALFCVPVSFLLSFKFILDMSFLGALMLCIIAVFGFFMMGKFIGGGFSANNESTARIEIQRPSFSLKAANIRQQNAAYFEKHLRMA